MSIWQTSQVEGEVVKSILAWEEVVEIQSEWELEFVQCCGERVIEHAVEDKISKEPHGVLEDDHHILHKWIKHDAQKQVGVLDAGSSEGKSCLLELWFQITILV